MLDETYIYIQQSGFLEFHAKVTVQEYASAEACVESQFHQVSYWCTFNFSKPCKREYNNADEIFNGVYFYQA